MTQIPDNSDDFPRRLVRATQYDSATDRRFRRPEPSSDCFVDEYDACVFRLYLRTETRVLEQLESLGCGSSRN